MYKLIKHIPNSNLRGDIVSEKEKLIQIAQSPSLENLEYFCTNILKQKTGKPEVITSQSYYIIETPSFGFF